MYNTSYTSVVHTATVEVVCELNDSIFEVLYTCMVCLHISEVNPVKNCVTELGFVRLIPFAIVSMASRMIFADVALELKCQDVIILVGQLLWSE